MNWLLTVLSAVNAVLFAFCFYIFHVEKIKDNFNKTIIPIFMVLAVGNICGGLFQHGWVPAVIDWPGIVYIANAFVFGFYTLVILDCWWNPVQDSIEACIFGFLMLMSIVGATHYWHGEKIIRLYS